MKKTFGLAILSLALMSSASWAVKINRPIYTTTAACDITLRSVNFGLTEVVEDLGVQQGTNYTFKAASLSDGLYRLNINYPGSPEKNEEFYLFVDESLPQGFVGLTNYMDENPAKRDFIDGYAFCFFGVDKAENVPDLQVSANTRVQKIKAGFLPLVTSTAASFTVTLPCAQFHFVKEANGFYRFAKITFDHVAGNDIAKREEIVVPVSRLAPVPAIRQAAAPAARQAALPARPAVNDDDDDINEVLAFSRAAHIADQAEQRRAEAAARQNPAADVDSDDDVDDKVPVARQVARPVVAPAGRQNDDDDNGDEIAALLSIPDEAIAPDVAPVVARVADDNIDEIAALLAIADEADRQAAAAAQAERDRLARAEAAARRAVAVPVAAAPVVAAPVVRQPVAAAPVVRQPVAAAQAERDRVAREAAAAVQAARDRVALEAAAAQAARDRVALEAAAAQAERDRVALEVAAAQAERDRVAREAAPVDPLAARREAARQRADALEARMREQAAAAAAEAAAKQEKK